MGARSPEENPLSDPLDAFYEAAGHHPSGPVTRGEGLATLRSTYSQELLDLMKREGDADGPGLDEERSDSLELPESVAFGQNIPARLHRDICLLIHTARHAAQRRGDRTTFYQAYRNFLEGEHQLPPARQRHFLAHLSVLLSGRVFVTRGKQKTVIHCSEQDLDREIPFVYARDDSSRLPSGMSTAVSFEDVGERVQLIEVLAGLELTE